MRDGHRMIGKEAGDLKRGSTGRLFKGALGAIVAAALYIPGTLYTRDSRGWLAAHPNG